VSVSFLTSTPWIPPSAIVFEDDAPIERSAFLTCWSWILILSVQRTLTMGHARCNHRPGGASGRFARSPYAHFRRALGTGNLALIRTAAAELPQINLDDALRIRLVIRERELGSFDRAACRWLRAPCRQRLRRRRTSVQGRCSSHRDVA